ncbi:MAG: DUF4362 domain-containing protein [bacterium]|nr:DUF4362 domain-containing protein [bacterium]
MKKFMKQTAVPFCCMMCFLHACGEPDVQEIEKKDITEQQERAEGAAEIQEIENNDITDQQEVSVEIEEIQEIENNDITEHQEESVEVEDIFDLDTFYQNPALQEYKDIRNLEESYSKEQAQSDNCFVIGATVHNDGLYDEFMVHVQNGEDAFIRVVQYNTEGDVIIDDILYVCDSDKVYLVYDRTRDRFADENDRSITLYEFDNIAEYNYRGHLYWVVFNGEMSDAAFESANPFIITLIN